MSDKLYHWCIVPQCSSTSRNAPQKLFIAVPRSVNIRKKWFELARRNPKDLSTKSSLYMCEDHFDLPNDVKNYMEYKIMGCVKIVSMKQGCLPSRFECQPDRNKRTTTTTLRPAVAKRQRLALVAEALEEATIVEEERLPSLEPEETASELEVTSTLNKSIQVNIHRAHFRSKACVLADRGFKHIEELLLERGFKLLGPPSVTTGSKLSKDGVRQTKEIASLRIHVERVIRRIREFHILKPHSVVNNNLIGFLDEIITIASALVNLQGSLIK